MAERECKWDKHCSQFSCSGCSLSHVHVDNLCIVDVVLYSCPEDDERAEDFRDRIAGLLRSVAPSAEIVMHYEVESPQWTEPARVDEISKSSVQQWFYISENCKEDPTFVLRLENHITRSISSQDDSFLPVFSKQKSDFHALPYGLNAFKGICVSDSDARIKRTLKQILGSEYHQKKKQYMQRQHDIERKRWQERQEFNQPQNVMIGGAAGVIADSSVRVPADFLGAGNSGREPGAGSSGRDVGAGSSGRDVGAGGSGRDSDPAKGGRELEPGSQSGKERVAEDSLGQRKEKKSTMAERECKWDKHCSQFSCSGCSLCHVHVDNLCIVDVVLFSCPEDDERAEDFRDRIAGLLSSVTPSAEIVMHYEVESPKRTELARVDEISKSSVQQWYYISENCKEDPTFVLSLENHITRSISSQDNSFLPVFSKQKSDFHALPYGLNTFKGVCVSDSDARIKRTLKQILGSEYHQKKKQRMQRQHDIERKQRQAREELEEQGKCRRQEERHRQRMAALQDENTPPRPSTSTLPPLRSSTPLRSWTDDASSSDPSSSSPASSLLPSSLFSSSTGSPSQNVPHYEVTINQPQNVMIGGAAGVIADSSVRVPGDFLGAGNSGREPGAGSSGRDVGTGSSGRDVGARGSGRDSDPAIGGRELEPGSQSGKERVAEDSLRQRKDRCAEGVDDIVRAADVGVTLAKSMCDVETAVESDTPLKQLASTTGRAGDLNLSETGSPAVQNLSASGSAAGQLNQENDSMQFSSDSFEQVDYPTD